MILIIKSRVAQSDNRRARQSGVPAARFSCRYIIFRRDLSRASRGRLLRRVTAK
jgi:hypothetical protein